MPNRICIDPGHGGIKSGAVYGGLQEKDINLAVALELEKLLNVLGYDVIMTRISDVDVSLQERCDIANASPRADLFVSLHCNADPDADEPGMPEAKGEEIWYFKGSFMGRKYATKMAYWIDDIFPDEPFRGVKETDQLYVLKNTNMPAVLIEMGFIDKTSSIKPFSDCNSLKRIAKAIADGIGDAVYEN